MRFGRTFTAAFLVTFLASAAPAVGEGGATGAPPQWVYQEGAVLTYAIGYFGTTDDLQRESASQWTVGKATDSTVAFTFKTTDSSVASLQGDWTVALATREVLSAPDARYEGASFWLWIPQVRAGDVVRLWDAQYTVVQSDDPDFVVLQALWESGETSTLKYAAGPLVYYSEQYTDANGAVTVTVLDSVEAGTMPGARLAATAELIGRPLIAFAIFFAFYKFMMKKKIATALAAAMPSAFCGSCGTPAAGAAFCGGCGAATREVSA